MSGATALKHKIKIMEQTSSDGEYGTALNEDPEDWMLIATVRAQYRDLSGNEFFSSRQVNPKLTGEFKVRYREDILSKYKIVWGDRIFDIAGPPRDITGKRLWLFINVEELSSADYFREGENG
jgi:SPP1 family predicted phage head-tail adaptor